jgi:hypothetical protein
MPDEYDSAAVGAKFKGDKLLPVDVSLTASFRNAAGEDPVKFTQSVVSRGDLSEPIARVVERVGEESTGSQDVLFRTVSALAFVYKDGSVDAKLRVAEPEDHVAYGPHLDMARGMRIFSELDRGKMPQYVVHIHSHPGPDFRPAEKADESLLITQQDYRGYQKLSALFSASAGKEIPVVGMVRPVGNLCGDVVIQTRVGPFDPDGAIARQAQLMKGRRALGYDKR